jgi:membrane protease YdiL (CAAX protease family)
MANKNKSVAAVWSHALPFAAWLALMTVPGLPPAWNYALRTALCLVLFLWLCPSRGYDCPKIRDLPPAFLVGVAVFAVWIFPESSWIDRWPKLRDLYLRWAVLPVGKMPAPTFFPFAPEVCGWPLALVRLAGSALVIAPIEEFFWRGLAYRWLIGKEFTQVDLGTLRWPILLTVSVCFGIEHDRWLAGLMAGLAYGLLMIRTRNIWAAVVAHVVTNFLLGLYVLADGAYQFW